MQGKIQVRLAMLAALAALVAVIVPSGLVAGADELIVGEDSGVVLLSLGDEKEVTLGDQTQSISTRRNKCTPVTLGDSPELLILSVGGGELGYDDAGLGVASQGEGNSGKCAQTNADAGESLTVSLGADLTGYLMDAVDLDLELKFDALVVVSYMLGDEEVASDEFDGKGADDGPDSADNDNYRYDSLARGYDGVLFDRLIFTPTNGAFALESGADGTEVGSLDTNSLSQFRVSQVFDGKLDCYPASAQIGEITVDTTYGTVIMRSQDNGSGWDVDDCLLKPYNAGTLQAALSYVPELSGTQARYTIDVTVEEQEITVDSGPGPTTGMITSLIAVYNTSGDLTFPDSATDPLQACNFTPPTDGGPAGGPVPAEYLGFWQQGSPVDDGVLAGGPGDDLGVDLLPDGASACFYSASVTPTGLGESGEQIGTEQWSIYFEDDPGWGFR